MRSAQFSDEVSRRMLSKSEWEQAQQRVTKAWSKGDLSSAFAEIDGVLRDGTSDMKGQALLYRGMIRESHEDLAGAEQDLTDAISSTRRGSYARYVAERSLGDLAEKKGLRAEALIWYRTALTTCANGD
jgi:tetratricopeptide (TPR) repeat protein